MFFSFYVYKVKSNHADPYQWTGLISAEHSCTSVTVCIYFVVILLILVNIAGFDHEVNFLGCSLLDWQLPLMCQTAKCLFANSF